MSSRRKRSCNILNIKRHVTSQDLSKNGFSYEGHGQPQVFLGNNEEHQENSAVHSSEFLFKNENFNFEEFASSASEASAEFERSEEPSASDTLQREHKKFRTAEEPIILTPFYQNFIQPKATFTVDGNIWKTEPKADENMRFDSAFDVPGYESDMLSCFGNSQLSEPVDFWRLFCTEDWLNKICEYTNKAGRGQYQNKWQDTDITELEALFGIWYMTGLLGMADISINTLFSTTPFCGSFYAPLTFPRIRYQQLSSMLRFDDGSPDSEMDQLAPIREIFDMAVGNFRSLSVIGKNVSVGRVNLNFDGTYEFFTRPLSKRTARSTVCIRCVNDANTLFLHNAEICLSGSAGVNGTTHDDETVQILRLTENLHLCGRLIVCEQSSTSLNLADELYSRMTYILGAISDERLWGLPEKFIKDRSVDRGYQFLFSNHRALLKYHSTKALPSNQGCVVLFSTAYNSSMCLGGKPVMICDFESYKPAVDSFNKLLSRYSCKQAGRKWPIRVLYWLLDAAAYNANCLYEAAKNPLRSLHIDYKSAAARREFLSKLAYSLIEAQIKRRDALAILPTNWYFKATKEVVDKMQFIAQKCSRIAVPTNDQQLPSPLESKEVPLDQVEGSSFHGVGAGGADALPYWHQQPFDSHTSLYDQVMRAMPIKGRRCVYCDRKKDRKTRNICRSCGKPVCTSHSRCDKMFVCIPCCQP